MSDGKAGRNGECLLALYHRTATYSRISPLAITAFPPVFRIVRSISELSLFYAGLKEIATKYSKH